MASWFFGGGKKEPQQFGDFVPPTVAIGGDDNEKPPKKDMHAYNFDSAALERAADAAKELEKSKFAKEAFELSKMQQITKQGEMETRRKELELHIEQVKIESQSKLMQDQAKIDQQKAQYQDQLARKRYEEQLGQQQRMNEDQIRRQEESVSRQEAIKRDTFQKELEKTTAADLKKIEAQYSAKGRYKRENRDILLEEIKHTHELERETDLMKIREERETKLQSFKSMASIVGYGLNDFISDPNKMKNVVLSAVALAVGIYTAKRGSKAVFNHLEATLMKPQLVTNTSRVSPIDFIKHPIRNMRKMNRKSGDVLDGIILSPEVESRVRDIAIAAMNTRKNKGYFSNITLIGPPGTGKTMFAEKLATVSGMDYAIISGGDLSIPGKDSVNELNKLFNWAERKRKGTILFIDEADSFLSKRSNSAANQFDNKIVSAFLHRTGSLSKRFCVVLSSNRPEIFDYAASSRSNEFVEFPLPGTEERYRMIMRYFRDFIIIPSTTGFSRLKMVKFDYSKTCAKISEITEGFSGRELVALANDWQQTTYSSETGIFNEKLMIDRAIAAIEQNEMRKMILSQKEIDRNKFSFAVMKAAGKKIIEEKGIDLKPQPIEKEEIVTKIDDIEPQNK